MTKDKETKKKIIEILEHIDFDKRKADQILEVVKKDEK